MYSKYSYQCLYSSLWGWRTVTPCTALQMLLALAYINVAHYRHVAAVMLLLSF
jgi:hypothetical protein